jgi:hypothetical protein
MLRDAPLAALPALLAAVMLASSASAMPSSRAMAILCSGGSAKIPGRQPDGDCDTACHAGCGRRKSRS